MTWRCRCNQSLLNDDGMAALGQVYHVDCFACVFCDEPFRDKPYYVRGGRAYCIDDYLAQFAKSVCAGCMGSFRKGDVAMEALGKVSLSLCCCAGHDGRAVSSCRCCLFAVLMGYVFCPQRGRESVAVKCMCVLCSVHCSQSGMCWDALSSR